jgi:hypothetical protein
VVLAQIFCSGHLGVRIFNLACSSEGSWCLPEIIYPPVLPGPFDVRTLIYPPPVLSGVLEGLILNKAMTYPASVAVAMAFSRLKP